jgi:hypothetical protein
MHSSANPFLFLVTKHIGGTKANIRNLIIQPTLFRTLSFSHYYFSESNEYVGGFEIPRITAGWWCSKATVHL